MHIKRNANMQQNGKERDITARVVGRTGIGGDVHRRRDSGEEGYGGAGGPVRFLEEESQHLETAN